MTKAQDFAAAHIKGVPLILYNIWDVGTAQAAQKAGAKAVATGSWSVAASQGFADGQALPVGALAALSGRIARGVDVPVSVDFEGGYADAPDDVAANAVKLAEAGVVGINFEDRVVDGQGLWSIEDQVARIAAIRAACPDLFINARTDVFFGGLKAAPEEQLAEVHHRGVRYAEAGASGLFVPGLKDPAMIAELARADVLPLNIMRMDGVPENAALAELGVARISYGPGPYVAAMAAFQAAAAEIYGTGEPGAETR